ncbi:hypothetical protein [Streptomyces varsoviensis]|uniref:Uncharacterized protein n=1 Tax=Streptomyces varsoviensis TaxID=67373 RepID=A0ABR5JFP1_9ACTN|nr:hypothetical protein [Streptomyces varsoviensis]KOG91886.1 hypothetical protein ADK38_00705 [Streptomyces varsoviensis]
MFFQLFDGSSSVETVLISGVAVAMLAVARVVKNLPKDSFSKFFEHRTTKYQIIAGDTKGRVAVVQKQRLLFLAFLCVCVAVVVLVLVSPENKKAEVPASPPTPTTAHAAPTPQ